MSVDYRVHRSEDRGGAEYSWLKTKHSFSFAHYYNPYRMGFGALRVINEDLIAPHSGFEIHPHKDMEIVSYVREGTLSHADTEGNSGKISQGIVQRMSAGKGIYHSEKNKHDNQVHLFQIWMDTKEMGIQPDYEEFNLAFDERQNNLIPIASGFDDRTGKALYIHQDAEFLLGNLDPKAKQYHVLRGDHHGAYVHVIEGDMQVNGHRLKTGDALQVKGASKLNFNAFDRQTEYLVFDVPMTNFLDPRHPRA